MTLELPDLVSMEGTEEEILARLRGVWFSEFKAAELVFDGMRIVWDERLNPGEDLESAFWHLVTRESGNVGVRRIDRERAARLPWCAALLRNHAAPELLVWDFRESHGKRRTYLWYEAGQYVIVLEPKERRDQVIAYIVTAFVVDGRDRERALRRKYERRLR